MDTEASDAEPCDLTENCDPNTPAVVDKNAKVSDDANIDILKVHKESDSESVSAQNDESKKELVTFTVIFNKNKHEITFGHDQTIKELKIHLESIIGVVENAQKLLIKGMAKDDMTLRSAGITNGGKVMVIGSKMNDILSVTYCKQLYLLEESTANSSTSKESISDQKVHRKILDKGIPPDAMPGIKGVKEPLPPVPLSGMLNKHGGKVRLTFKLEQDQLWLGTKERTEKLALTSIKSITSEPIKENEEYHLMGLQLGPTEASRYWVYWVPAQYVEAIKDAVLGKWQQF